jgi:hypothetical protein
LLDERLLLDEPLLDVPKFGRLLLDEPMVERLLDGPILERLLLPDE